MLALALAACGGSGGSLEAGSDGAARDAEAVLDAAAIESGAPDAGAGETSDGSRPDGAVPVDRTTCAVALDLRVLRCERYRDPQPLSADDESLTTLLINLAGGALDGSTRRIAATTDHVLTELSFEGEMVVETRLRGLAGRDPHDAAIERVLVWHRVHQLHRGSVYDRTDVTGEVMIDAEGHGHVVLSWTDPAHDRAPPGSIEASF